MAMPVDKGLRPGESQAHANAAISRRMSVVRVRDTAPERALRVQLHRRGLRYRVHRPIAALARTRADIVFVTPMVAVFVDGCFWHGCRKHRPLPRTNTEWWRHKLAVNRRRDLITSRRLRALGWRVVRVWEHEDVNRAAERIAALLRGSSPRPKP